MAKTVLNLVYYFLFILHSSKALNMRNIEKSITFEGNDDGYLDLNDMMEPLPKEDRNAIKGAESRWTNGTVPYEIDSSFNSSEISIINRAMRRIENASENCVQFVQKSSNDTKYVSIKKLANSAACASHVGKLSNGQNKIFYHPICFKKYGTILHEMLHTLGFFHEHQRPERWYNIFIVQGNIKEGKEHNFKAHQTNGFGVGYDYDSVMHYPATAFAKRPGALTIYPFWRPFNIGSLGQRIDLSKGDIEKIKRMYC